MIILVLSLFSYMYSLAIHSFDGQCRLWTTTDVQNFLFHLFLEEQERKAVNGRREERGVGVRCR